MNSASMTDKELLERWSICLEFIKDNVPSDIYSNWFRGITPLSYANKELTVSVKSAFVYEFIEQNCLSVFKAALTKTFGRGTRLMYNVLTDKENQLSQDIESSAESTFPVKTTKNTGNKAPSDKDTPYIQDLNPQLNPNYSFDNFVEGISNKLVRTAGETIALNPATTAFNPLFIYGASGVGKTHLVNAIGSKVRELHPELRVLYLSSHLFQVQYVDAVKANTINDFIHFYQSIDVLIIDDIQEMAGLKGTQNTFFHIFNHLHLNHKQLIMTSDRPPKDLKDLEERLITRFKWGLVAELEKPDFELRREILKDKARRDGLKFSDAVINYLAKNITENVRDLEGALVSLMAHSTINGKEADIELAKLITERITRKESKPVTIESIISKVCDYYGIDTDAIQTKSRKHEVVQVRQISMYLAKKYLDLSTSKIGAYIGKRDHATVLHACTTVRDQIEVDKSFKTDMENIESSLRC